MKRVVTTASSVWMLDTDAHIVTRVPREESPEHPYMSYEEIGRPQSYVNVEDAGSDRYPQLFAGEYVLRFTDEHGEFLFRSGVVESDTHPPVKETA